MRRWVSRQYVFDSSALRNYVPANAYNLVNAVDSSGYGGLTTTSKALRDAQEQAAPIITRTFLLNYTKADVVSGTLRGLLSPRGNIITDPRRNALKNSSRTIRPRPTRGSWMSCWLPSNMESAGAGTGSMSRVTRTAAVTKRISIIATRGDIATTSSRLSTMTSRTINLSWNRSPRMKSGPTTWIWTAAMKCRRKRRNTRKRESAPACFVWDRKSTNQTWMPRSWVMNNGPIGRTPPPPCSWV